MMLLTQNRVKNCYIMLLLQARTKIIKFVLFVIESFLQEINLSIHPVFKQVKSFALSQTSLNTQEHPSEN